MAGSTHARRRFKSREHKSERLELRLAPSAKRLIRRAIAVTGFGAGDLAYEGARRVLDEHERFVLTGPDQEAFLEALRKSPKPPQKLVAAFRRHREILG
jgi:uncharacterized protein (DUF1778 family)